MDPTQEALDVAIDRSDAPNSRASMLSISPTALLTHSNPVLSLGLVF